MSDNDKKYLKLVEWRDPTIDAHFEETYDLPRSSRADKWIDLAWMVGGLVFFFMVGGIIGSGWV